METLCTADAVLVIMRSYIHMDESLSRLIRAGLKRGSFLDIKEMTFKRKVDLVAAAGLIDEDSVSWYRMFNGLRNRVAHTLPIVHQADVLSLYAHVNPYLKRTCDVLLIGEKDGLLMLRVQIVAMAAEMEARLQALEA